VGSSASLSPVDPSIIVLGTATTLGTVIFLVTNIVGPTREATAGQIEGKKDFEVKKEFVLGIVMRRPQGFGIGHVMIDLQSGDDVKIIIGNKRVFRKTKELVGAFYPEAHERP